MKFKELKNKIKEEQKHLANQITKGKHFRKPKNRINLSEEDIKLYFWKDYNSLFYIGISRKSYNYRARHVAYCMFFNNTPYEKIENPKQALPILESAKEYIRIWEKQLDEAVRDCA